MILKLPLSVVLPRKKKADKVWILNMNNYRNTHHMILNQAKQEYYRVVYLAVIETGVKFNEWANNNKQPYVYSYTIFPPNGRSFDLSNVCSVIDKFAADALQEIGLLGNDNYKNIPIVNYLFGKIDKDNPRCELEIKSINN